MKKIVMLVCTSLLLAACSKAPAPENTPATDDTSQVIEETVPAGPMMTLALSAQNNSGQSGTALVEEVDGKVQVTVELMGQPAGSTQPAHFHTGTCEKPGAVTFPLTSLVDGKSVTTLDTTLEALKSGSTIINVHKSAQESNVYVACGDVVMNDPLDQTVPADNGVVPGITQ